MNSLILKCIIFLSAAVLLSCEIESGLTVNPESPCLVIQGINSNNTDLLIRVSRSLPVIGSLQSQDVSNANVSIRENQSTEISLIYMDMYPEDSTDNRKYYIAPEGIRLQPKGQYTLKIFAPGLPPIVSSTTIPQVVPIDSTQFTSQYLKRIDQEVGESEVFVPITVTFTDIEGDDFYEIAAYSVYHTVVADPNTGDPIPATIKDPLYVYSYNMALNPYNIQNAYTIVYGDEPRLMFSDETFSNATVTLECLALIKNAEFTNSGPIPINSYNPSVVVELRHVSKDYYLFRRTYRQYANNKDSPFVEPINVFSNIEGGYGIFVGYATDERTLDTQSAHSIKRQ